MKLLSRLSLVIHSIMTSVWLQPNVDACGMRCLSTSPGAPLNGTDEGDGSVVEGGDGWRQANSCVDRLETLRAVRGRADGIYAQAGCVIWEPDIFSRPEISR